MAALTDQDRTELRELTEQKWISAALAKDWEACVALCSEDLVYMPPDHPLLHGRAETEAYLKEFPDVKDFGQKLVGIGGDRDLAVLRATFAGTFVVDGQELSGVGKVLATAEHRGGSWVFSAVCFNWDAPPSPNA